MNKRSKNARHASSAGFSLVELIAIVAIALILLTMGMPSFRAVIDNQKLASAANDFFSAINLARSEAIRRGVRVDLVPAGERKEWTDGWIVLVDSNRNQKADAGEQVLFVHGPAPTGLSIHSTFTDSSSRYLAYTASGRTRTNANGQTAQVGSVHFSVNGRSKRIVINFLGRPRMCTPKPPSITC